MSEEALPECIPSIQIFNQDREMCNSTPLDTCGETAGAHP